jgi:hypothetical protein
MTKAQAIEPVALSERNKRIYARARRKSVSFLDRPEQRMYVADDRPAGIRLARWFNTKYATEMDVHLVP